ncbi:MAG: ATP-dependent DNA helicase [Burkholderiales bacterium]
MDAQVVLPREGVPASATMYPMLRELFDEGGALAKGIPDYHARAQQLEMADSVARAIEEYGVLVCEAGTGTGKMLAYLVPALLSGGKVIVSTGTKTLQDQLYHRDLPTVCKAINAPVTTALLKGRANYVCHYHLKRNLKEGLLLAREDIAHLHSIARFANVSQSGDRGEATEVPENSPVWSLATSTRENCLGQQCPDHDKCYVMAARREALAAEVVVVNHHLFFADIMLKDEGMAELLPACNTVILDEAHQLPQTATLFFGESLATGQLLELARDAKVAIAQSAADMPDLPAFANNLDRAARELRLALPRQPARFSGAALRADKTFEAAVDVLAQTLAALAAAMERVAERDEGLARCANRATEACECLSRWRNSSENNLVQWAESYAQSLSLNASPLSVAEFFRGQIDARPRAWILTSATLAVAGDFSHYLDAMGMEAARTACWDSPFDYPNHALLYVPRALPEPGSNDHTRAVVAAALPLIRAARGSAFLLFTTLRAMRLARELLAEAFVTEGLPYPLFSQGEGSRSELLERFRKLGNAVLVASASFWEGVDVRGEALRLVVIDKLPFAPPDDPVMEERLAAIARAGRNAFMTYQLPHAAISLKQGAGRLIRDEQDRGVLVICDPRLTGKSYGRKLIASLPPMRLTRETAEAEEFLKNT